MLANPSNWLLCQERTHPGEFSLQRLRLVIPAKPENAAVQGYYFTGDGCRRDAEGRYWITGRVDDVINVSGHRIGTAVRPAAWFAWEIGFAVAYLKLLACSSTCPSNVVAMFVADTCTCIAFGGCSCEHSR